MKDSAAPCEEQVKTILLKLPGGMWVEMPETGANRRGLMIVLRCLRTAEGRPLVTYERLAEELDYADRRNVHNYWMDFESCGSDLEAFLVRRKKVDAEGVARCEQIWQGHLWWSVVQVYEEYKRRWPESGATLSAANIRAAGHQISFLKLQQGMRRQLQDGSASYREAVLIESLLDLASTGAEQSAQAAGATGAIPEILEQVSPRGPLPDGADSPPTAAGATMQTAWLEGESSPSALAALWQGPTGWLMLMFMLYYHGLSLSVIGKCFGVHKTTVMRWLEPVAQVSWQALVQQGKRFFSGTVAIDEKWIQVQGTWWYLFAAVDHVSGMPLHVALLPSNNGNYCRLFLLPLKALGYRPKVVITDGWDAYVQALAMVFPQTQHLLCRFHALRAVFRALGKQVQDWKARQAWIDPLKTLFHTPSKRTVNRRMTKLQAQAQDTPAEGIFTRLANKLPKLLPAVGSTFRPSTSNAVERFFGRFDHFYQAKGPFQSRASAEKHVALFLLGYVFETYSDEAQASHQGRCPLQLAGYQVDTVPLFHLLNRPNLMPLRKRLIEGYANAA